MSASSSKAMHGEPRQTYPALSVPLNIDLGKQRVALVPNLGCRLFVFEEGFIDENGLAAPELL